MDMEIKRLNASELKRMTLRVRSNILDMIPAGKVGHLGGSSSIADVATVLYMGHMRVFDDPKDPARDRLIFSKGHAVLAQYACLVELGYFDREELHHVKTLTGLLQGHPDMSIPGIEAVTGSLGQGLSVSLGMALGLKLDHSDSRVFCVLGDGELDEGQVWEAAMAASHTWPSSSSPSPSTQNTRESLWSSFRPSAMPSDTDSPCPREPVTASMPGMLMSGWPWRRPVSVLT